MTGPTNRKSESIIFYAKYLAQGPAYSKSTINVWYLLCSIDINFYLPPKQYQEGNVSPQRYSKVEVMESM